MESSAKSVSKMDTVRYFHLNNNFRPFDVKNSGFVEFDDSRDAEDAVRDMNGERLCGERVTIEMAKGSQTCSGWLIHLKLIFNVYS